MKNNKGFAPLVVLLVVLGVLAVGGVAYFAGKSAVSKNEVSDTYLPSIQRDYTSSAQNINNNPQASTPSQTQGIGGGNNVTDQPAYLIKAYSQNSKNYIDVDYIDVLSGSASLQAQVADGKCPNVNDCYDLPNGYKRNQNSLVRTFEVSSGAPITIDGLLFSKKFDIAYAVNNNGSNYYAGGGYHNDYAGNQGNHNSTFTEFKNLVSQAVPSLPYAPSFQKPITYIRIDVHGNSVTKITEPYQE